MVAIATKPALTRDEVNDLAYDFLKNVSAGNLLYVKNRAAKLSMHPSEFLDNIINTSRILNGRPVGEAHGKTKDQ